MSRMIQIRHVPDRLHQRLKSRAAAAGMALSDFLKVELERIGSQLSPDEMRARLSHLEPMRVRETPVKALRFERDSR